MYVSLQKLNQSKVESIPKFLVCCVTLSLRGVSVKTALLHVRSGSGSASKGSHCDALCLHVLPSSAFSPM